MMLRAALLLGFIMPVIAQDPKLGDPAGDVAERLRAAKLEYDNDAEKFKQSVRDWLDAREAVARKEGNKKLVDQILMERKVFQTLGDLPLAGTAGLKDPLAAARTKLNAAYTAAVKDYVRLKKDDAATATEKEQFEFHISSALLIGKKKYLVTLKQTNVVGTFSLAPVKFNGVIAGRSIFLHPAANSASEVSYTVSRNWKALHATVGIPTIEEGSQDPVTPLTFEVLGDGKSLWKSVPVIKLDRFQICDLAIEKVKVITLKVHCPGASNWARAHWFEPALIE